jgi:hypothetical protein
MGLTREDLQAAYDRHATMLTEMVQVADRHVAAHPDCPSVPMCIGGKQAAVVHTIALTAPDQAALMVIVAVLELSRAGKREDALRGRLEVQRKLTADAVQALESAHSREQAAEDEHQFLLARLDELRNRP